MPGKFLFMQITLDRVLSWNDHSLHLLNLKIYLERVKGEKRYTKINKIQRHWALNTE